MKTHGGRNGWKGRRRRLTRRQRRRLARAVGALAGTFLAAAGGWLYAGGRLVQEPGPASTLRGSQAFAAPSSPRLGTLGPSEPGDPQLRHGVLEVPVVDFAELMPGCHK